MNDSSCSHLQLNTVDGNKFDLDENDSILNGYPKDAEPVFVEFSEYRNWMDRLFVERFGRYDSADPIHINLRSRLLSGLFDVTSCSKDSSGDSLLKEGEVTCLLNEKLAEELKRRGFIA